MSTATATLPDVKNITPLKFALLVLLGMATLLALILVPAGRVDWMAGWIYVAVLMLSWSVTFALMWRNNPELMRRRMSAGAGTRTWDRLVLVPFRLSTFAIFVVAGLDAVRFSWSSMPSAWWPVGLLLHLAGLTIVTASMLTNRHFEGTVRIQSDRHHQVVSTGTYAYVRHPGYVGILVTLLGAPFMLFSWWALVPFACVLLSLVVRTALEDRMLQLELPGYKEYAQRVRYRLVPGLW